VGKDFLNEYVKDVSIRDMDRRDRRDKLVLKAFPYVIALSLILVLSIMVFLNDISISTLLYALCMGFATGFTILGASTIPFSDKGTFTMKAVIPGLLLLLLFISIIMYMFGSDFAPSQFLMQFFDIFGETHEFADLLSSLSVLILMIILVSQGVLSVIVAYFRHYMNRVLNSLEAPSDRKRSKITSWMFAIPDIIDIKEVCLEPIPDEGKFNKSLFLSTSMSLFLLGTAICSYLFLNPLFLTQISAAHMLFIGTMLSLFLPPLVIPWSIFQSIGAKIRSDAPRDLYLWKGMKGRLYFGFFAITMFTMLITLAVYIGADFGRIVGTYLGYIILMVSISLITSFIYMNWHYYGFKADIIVNFVRDKAEKVHESEK